MILLRMWQHKSIGYGLRVAIDWGNKDGTYGTCPSQGVTALSKLKTGGTTFKECVRVGMYVPFGGTNETN